MQAEKEPRFGDFPGFTPFGEIETYHRVIIDQWVEFSDPAVATLIKLKWC